MRLHETQGAQLLGRARQVSVRAATGRKLPRRRVGVNDVPHDLVVLVPSGSDGGGSESRAAFRQLELEVGCKLVSRDVSDTVAHEGSVAMVVREDAAVDRNDVARRGALHVVLCPLDVVQNADDCGCRQLRTSLRDELAHLLCLQSKLSISFLGAS